MNIKHKQLQDESWVKQKILEEKLTYEQIANIIGNGCSVSSVGQARKRFKIPSDRPPRKVGKSHYKQLNNKEWLNQKYFGERLSLIDIGEIVGCDCSVVSKALKRHNLKVRCKTEGRLYKRENTGFIFHKDLIEGSLLGDGSLTNRSVSKGFYLSSIHYDYIVYYGNLIYENFDESRIYNRKGGKCIFNNKEYNSKESYSITTKSEKQLTELYKQWYPNGIKIIPKSITVTARTLLHWFIEDGYTYYINRKHNGNIRHRIRLQLATQSFCKEDLEFLCDKIYKEFGLKLSPRFHQKHKKVKGTGYFLELSERPEQYDKFFDIIGSCPIKEFQYKWKTLDKDHKILDNFNN